jgi:hypothetical protein
LRRSAETTAEVEVQEGRRETGGSFRFGTVKKMQQFRRFALALTLRLPRKSEFSAVFLNFGVNPMSSGFISFR